MRDERKSAQGKEKGIIDELHNGAERVLNEIETEVDVAREQIQGNLDIIIQHWSSVTIGIVLAAIFVVFLVACFKCRTYRMVTWKTRHRAEKTGGDIEIVFISGTDEKANSKERDLENAADKRLEIDLKQEEVQCTPLKKPRFNKKGKANNATAVNNPPKLGI
ncbi:unnamed protein product [Toxocara canis]|uniref:Uncharacterized protein n=1 Tax=Toxocara canis TaxID=6265 RepID=A0A183UJG7_TOXCA|nr:unnamed protein product [Toxocara canis]